MTHKIFLLDDDPSLRNLLSSILESHGYEVFACETAAEAKKRIYEHNYSALLVDIFLPDLNGIEFVREIQEAGITAPTIIITGSSELDHAREAVRLNAFDYLVKPFKTTQFSQVVKNAVLQFELEHQKKEIEEQKLRYQEELERQVDEKIAELRKSRRIEQRYELELLNEHKLAAIGQLAAGIAHNMNTPISIIQGNAELLRMKYPDDVDEIDKILRQTGKLSELILNMLDKGRKEQDTNIIRFNLNDLLKEELDFLNADLYYKHHIKKEFDFDTSIPPVTGVYSDFSQSIMSFIQNAIDAMYQVPVRQLRIKTRVQEKYVSLIIQDSGCGMSESTQDRLFEPFFTTKKQKKSPGAENGFPRGTGLGLSIAYNILKKYDVKIGFTSEVGKGTIFELKIPVKHESENGTENRNSSAPRTEDN